ncbi:MAG: phosphoribosylanthranilate isomerase [Pseudomonadota bacterium]
MKRWVKICGMTGPADVAAALAAGADAIGFVFAPSVREVGVAQAKALAKPARGSVDIVAVMRHPTAAAARAVIDGFEPDIVQTDALDFAAMDVPVAVRRLPVYRDSAPPDAAELPAALLYESDASGSGGRADWHAASKLAADTAVVLAGGLDPDNVAAAIDAVQPAGVDVSSGVEALPGVKDPQRIHAFVAAARREFGG